jgi:long-subunit fatty acid transport protein
MPWYYVAGIAYRILPELLIDFDLWYMTWSNTDRITITAKDVDLQGGRDVKSVIQTYYKNSIDAMIGAEYLVNKKFTLRAGIKYEEQVPHDDRGVNISLNCETDRYTVTIGAGHRIIEQIELNLSFGYLYGVTNRVDSGTYYQSHKSVTAGVRILL